MKTNKRKLLYSFTIAVLVSAGFVPFVSRAQISEKQSSQTLNFQNLKLKSHAGDSVSFSMAQVAVPENRLSGKTNTIQLAILKLQARTANSNYPIVFLAGGPGQSGVNYIREEYFQKLVFQLQQNHDIILLDQRGSGRSLPSLTFKLPGSNIKDLFLSNESMIALADMASKAGADTFRKKGIDIMGYNTIQNADDLNDLRIALG
jgi:pimeloyl-ACP methyl ester carboxylesterase